MILDIDSVVKQTKKKNFSGEYMDSSYEEDDYFSLLIS
jgi:hypothetical protein